MMKHSVALLVSAMTSLLAGCSLYFGGSDNDGSWNYCGEDGYYECEGNDCFWRGPSCPAGTSTDPNPPGSFECNDNADCAAGCYCGADGTCEEAGFCTQDSDCGEGYTCNEDRSSCEPDTGPATCDWDSECAQGEYCSPATNQCTETCTCTDDETAVAGGFGWCDETRNTCLPGQDPAGSCAGIPTCSAAQPTCPLGQVPKLIDGCWTGECTDYASCDIAPECGHINDSQNCLGRTDCSAVYSGLNCTNTDGTACSDGDTNCTCTSFVFASCRTRLATRGIMVRSIDGYMLDASQLMLQN